MRKPLWHSAHSLIHLKSATPYGTITKRGSPYETFPIASFIRNQQPLVPLLQNEEALVTDLTHYIMSKTLCQKTLFLQNKKHLVSKHLKPKISTENSYFEYCKWYKRVIIHHCKSVLDCSLLRYHQLSIKVFPEDTLQYFSNIFTMEDILAMVEGRRTSEITSFEQIDQNLFKEFLI